MPAGVQRLKIEFLERMPVEGTGERKDQEVKTAPRREANAPDAAQGGSKSGKAVPSEPRLASSRVGLGDDDAGEALRCFEWAAR